MGYVYLIRTANMHKIGRTDNLQRRMKELDPYQVVQVAETDYSHDLELEMHRKFKRFRLPQSEYFFLGDKELNLALEMMGKGPGGPFPAAHLVNREVYEAKLDAEGALLTLGYCLLAMIGSVLLTWLDNGFLATLGLCLLLIIPLFCLFVLCVLAVATIRYLTKTAQHNFQQHRAI